MSFFDVFLLRSFTPFLNRAENERERGAELVRDVGKESGLETIHFREVLSLEMLHLHFLL